MTGAISSIAPVRAVILGAALTALAACGGGEGQTAADAQDEAGQAVVVPETGDPALDYARLFVPAGQVTEQGVALFRQTFDDGFASQPENLAAERADPGLRQAARDAGADAMRAVFRREIPGIQQRMADTVRPLASAEELREINRFMRSDTAAAMQGAAAARMAGAVRSRASDGGPAVRSGDFATAGAASAEAITPGQTAELMRFFATPAGQALNRMGPVARQTMMRETNAMAAKAEPEVAAAIRRAIESRQAAN